MVGSGLVGPRDQDEVDREAGDYDDEASKTLGSVVVERKHNEEHHHEHKQHC